jgi:thiamine-monophosphate kinase
MTSDSENKRRLGEFAVIARYFAPLAQGEGALGLKDDAAFLPAGDSDLVVTTDALVAGVHFLEHDPPDLIARKALRVNLSDLAAKGAVPDSYLMALTLPDWVEESWIQKFAEGLSADQKLFGIGLIGGDTTATPGPLTIAITALGRVPHGVRLLRSGAQPGDNVYVSGTIGDGGAGLAVAKGDGAGLTDAQRAFLLSRYQLPEARNALGPHLLGTAHAAIDVSDGLIADLGHIAECSSVRIAISAADIPLSPALVALWGQGEVAQLRAATAGDDYEIAFTAPEKAYADIMALSREAGISVTRIGRVETGEGVVVLGAAGQALSIERAGYTHF